MQNPIKCRLLKPRKGNLIAQKIIVLSVILLLFTNATQCLGQVLTLNSTKPKKGEIIYFTYDPKGGKFENDTLKTVSIIITDGFDQLSKKVNLVKNGNTYSGQFQTDSSTLLVVFAFSHNKVWDNAPKEGYIYPIYENNQPAEEALSAMADFYISKNMKTLFSAEPDYQKAIDLLQEEMKLYPDGKTKFTSLQKYYKALYKLNPQTAKTEIFTYIKNIDQQLQISDVDHFKKYRLYEILDMKIEMEKTLELITQQFPNSPVIFSRRYKDALTPRAAIDMEIIGKKLIEDYNMIKGTEFSAFTNSVYSALNQAYLKELNLSKFYFYLNQINQPTLKLTDIIKTATFLAEMKKELLEAEKLSNQGLGLIDTLINNQPAISAKFLKEKKTELTGLLGRIYYEQNILDKAYITLKNAHEDNIDQSSFIPIYYALVLVKKKEFNAAQPLLADAIKSGRTDHEIILAYKEAFINNGGNLSDYTVQLSELKEDAEKKRKLELEKIIQKTPAPNFSLLDTKGKRVSLTDYKGKIVVLDFWATWCIPCLEAFPGMNKLIKNYQNDKDVVFLFINTSETFTKDLTKKINSYLKKQRYNFHVLLDEKSTFDGVSIYKTNNSYGAEAIPLKVVIDKDGNIRFKSAGYLGSDEKVVEELSGFIEAAKS